jgi:hypothetical protein
LCRCSSSYRGHEQPTSFSAISTGIRFASPKGTVGGSAAITGNATVVAISAGQLVYGTANIDGTATLSADGNFVATGYASVNGLATVDVQTSVTYSAHASVSGTGNLIADGHIQGNNWTDVPVGTNIWLRIG